MKLPVFQAIRNGVVLATRVGRRHLRALIGFAVFCAVIRFATYGIVAHLPSGRTLLSITQAVVIGGALSIVAILVHREILVGPATFRNMFSGAALTRLGWYAIDLVTVFATMFILMLLQTPIIFVMPFGFLFVLMLLPMLVGTRLLLKLPARAIGEPMSWSQIWVLGRGNTLRLSVIFLASDLLFLISGATTGVVAEASLTLSFLADGILTVGQAVLGTAWLSVSYLYLTVGGETTLAESAVRPGS